MGAVAGGGLASLEGSQSKPKDRRIRYNVHWDIRAGHWEVGTVSGQIINVSLTGIKFRVAALYEVGNIIEIEMSPSATVCIRAIAQITRKHAIYGHEVEYGAAFRHLKEDDATAFHECLLVERRNM